MSEGLDYESLWHAAVHRMAEMEADIAYITAHLSGPWHYKQLPKRKPEKIAKAIESTDPV